MDAVLKAVGFINDNIVWGLPMIILMIGTGIYLTVLTRGVIFTRFNIVMRYTAKTLLRNGSAPAGEGAITPFQAVCTALAATVGTGNIVGVAVAIAAGGPGTVFWMWVSALVGMVIKYSEVTLSQAYRTVNALGETVGGPMYYIEKGMGRKRLAVSFAFFGAVASFGIGASVQANALAGSIHSATGIPVRIIGAAAAVPAALIFIGGIRRIAGIAEFLVPFMSVLYTLGALTVLAVNITRVPGAFAQIIRNAFTGTAATGGFLGASVLYACRTGIARGVFTHEAGMGSAPIAHACASSDHPARQGLWGAFEVFFDAIVMCTITALVILTSGLWCDPVYTDDSRSMCAAAFANAFPAGQHLVTGGLVLFAFATIVAWYCYGERCMEYLSGGNRHIRLGYRVVYTLTVYAGCVASLDTVWELADLCNGLMAIPNLAALIVLSPVIRHLSEDFFRAPDVIRPAAASFSHLTSERKKKDGKLFLF